MRRLQARVPRPTRRAHRGIVLIITLLLLVVIGLTAAYAMRSAGSGEKLANNLRLEVLAQQYAEAALRYCESQMTLAPADRIGALRNIETMTAVPVGSAAWRAVATWVPASSAVQVPSARLGNIGKSTFTPSAPPECLVEKVVLAAGEEAWLVTARGFSPGYAAHAATGATMAGSVVWLQSTLALN